MLPKQEDNRQPKMWRQTNRSRVACHIRSPNLLFGGTFYGSTWWHPVNEHVYTDPHIVTMRSCKAHVRHNHSNNLFPSEERPLYKGRLAGPSSQLQMKIYLHHSPMGKHTQTLSPNTSSKKHDAVSPWNVLQDPLRPCQHRSSRRPKSLSQRIHANRYFQAPKKIRFPKWL